MFPVQFAAEKEEANVDKIRSRLSRWDCFSQNWAYDKATKLHKSYVTLTTARVQFEEKRKKRVIHSLQQGVWLELTRIKGQWNQIIEFHS